MNQNNDFNQHSLLPNIKQNDQKDIMIHQKFIKKSQSVPRIQMIDGSNDLRGSYNHPRRSQETNRNHPSHIRSRSITFENKS